MILIQLDRHNFFFKLSRSRCNGSYEQLHLYLLCKYRILGECLLLSSLPGKALRMLEGKPINLISKDMNLVFYLSCLPNCSLFKLAIMQSFIDLKINAVR